MKLYNVVIVDDEIFYIAKLKQALAPYSGIKVVGEAGIPSMAKKIILAQRPELLFLDVELPGLNGLELLRNIQDQITWPMQVVFYTAYEKYLLEALRASAFDYLLKPFEFNDLDMVMSRFFEHSKKELANSSFHNSLAHLIPGDSTFMIATITGFSIVRLEQIGYFSYESDRRQWKVHLNNNSHLYLRRNTNSKDLLGFSTSFLQVSQIHIINIGYLAMINDKQCILFPPFDNVSDLSISRKFIAELQEKFCLI